MTGTKDLNDDLLQLTIQLMTLSQDLVTNKLKLENMAKTGWIMMAKARYVSPGGAASISINQVYTTLTLTLVFIYQH